MTRYMATLTNTFLDLNNVKMSDEAIQDILKRQPQVPVTINFGGLVVGRSIGFHMENDALICEVELDDKKLPLIERSYLVPGLENVEAHNEGRTRVVDRGDLTEVSVSLLPSNPHLRPIKLSGGSLTNQHSDPTQPPIELKGDSDEG